MTITPATHAISINPATGEQLSVLPWADVDDIENALQLAAAGFRDWRETKAGNYYPPTVLANVTPEMTAFREEMFGPVAAITIAKDAEHALELANDSEFGLSATIFTTDETQARQMAARLECGGVFINGYCASDARVAFGGVKKSGFGRELSHFGLHEFCNIQTVWKDRV